MVRIKFSIYAYAAVIAVLATVMSNANAGNVTEFYLPVPAECANSSTIESNSVLVDGVLTTETIETCNGKVIGYHKYSA